MNPRVRPSTCPPPAKLDKPPPANIDSPPNSSRDREKLQRKTMDVLRDLRDARRDGYRDDRYG